MTDDDLDVMFRQLDRIAKALDRIAPAADRDDDEFVYVMPAPGWCDSSGEVEPWNTIANFIRIEGPDDPTAT